MGFVSPNEMLSKAEEMMLDGRKAKSRKDWMLVMNFFAANTHPEVAEAACPLMAKIYDMPLTDEEVQEIVEFQLARSR